LIMQCIIPGKSIRIFAKMIQCLQKIGDDLFIEATDTKLVLRALNASRSAYFCFTILPNFFESYGLLQSGMDCRYKVLLKTLMSVFRTINNVEKMMMRITEDTEAKLIFELSSRNGIKKTTYKLNIEDCEPLQAVYSHENCPHRLVSRAKLLVDSIANFTGPIEEISLILTKNYVKIRSYFEDQKKPELLTKTLQTELTLDTHDFEKYDLNCEHIELTFSLKEMKAILGFCEVANQPIALYVDEGGKPLLLSVRMLHAFEADFVLATLLDTNTATTSELTSSSQPSRSSEHSSSSAHTDSNHNYNNNSVINPNERPVSNVSLSNAANGVPSPPHPESGTHSSDQMQPSHETHAPNISDGAVALRSSPSAGNEVSVRTPPHAHGKRTRVDNETEKTTPSKRTKTDAEMPIGNSQPCERGDNNDGHDDNIVWAKDLRVRVRCPFLAMDHCRRCLITTLFV
jgi:cell cycle checkpoint control protein RAD9A